MKKISLLVSAVIFLSQALPGLAIAQAPGAPKDDYAGLRLEGGTPTSSVPGDVTGCVSVAENSIITKKQFEWMSSQGLLVRSAPDKISFSEKITSVDGNSRVLLLGCWVFEGRTVKEVHGGRTFKFAKARFKINSIVKGSPFMETGLCLSIENPEKPFVFAADRQFTDPRCLAQRVNGKDLVIPIRMSQLEGQTKMFWVQ
jgi:hypothetical protein